jgi:hypothetical protein
MGRNTRQEKKAMNNNNNMNVSTESFIDLKLQTIINQNTHTQKYIEGFEVKTEDWRVDLDAKIALLLGMKADIEKLKQDNIAFNAFKDEITSTIKYMKWTYKIVGFVAGAVVAFIGFSEKIRILFFK